MLSQKHPTMHPYKIMSDILRELKKSVERYNLIAIPTEKELYFLIANTYLTKIIFNAILYVKNNFMDYAINYTEQITKQLKTKLDNSTYHFTIETLTKYIDKSIKCDFLDYDNNIFDIANDLSNLTYGDLLQDPLTYFNTTLDSCDYALMEHTPNKTIKKYIKEFMQNDFLIYATNTPINRLNHFTIFDY